jgi:F0F1-type ATP synthase alpha subunit
VSLERIRAFEQELQAWLDRRHPELLASIRTARDLSHQDEERLRAALTDFRREFLTPPSAAAGARGSSR